MDIRFRFPNQTEPPAIRSKCDGDFSAGPCVIPARGLIGGGEAVVVGKEAADGDVVVHLERGFDANLRVIPAGEILAAEVGGCLRLIVEADREKRVGTQAQDILTVPLEQGHIAIDPAFEVSTIVRRVYLLES